jgi:segregation and condensation protein B
MRELPADAGSVRSRSERIKGPEELALLARGVAAEELMVTAPRPPADGAPADGEPPIGPDGGPDGVPEAGPPEAGSPDAVSPDTGSPDIGPEVGADEAAAAVAAEAEALEIDEVSAGDAEEGLPPVPELADAAAAGRIVFVLLLTQKEGLSLLRLAQACNTTQKIVDQALQLLEADLKAQGLPLEVARTGDVVRLLSAAAAYPYLVRLRGVKKLEKLSPAALETLAVIAYKQPVMRSEIESIRGVKAGPMLRTLLQHKLVRVTGRADVPGRPLQYGTTQQFLDRFGLASLQDLPELREFKQLG